MTHSPEENRTTAETMQLRQQIQTMARGFRQSQILLTCVELGVFELLAQQPASAQALAQALSADERGVELLLNAAAALDLLQKSNGVFANTPISTACLTSGGASDLSQNLRLESAFYRRWGNLADAVRSGRRPEENVNDEKPADWVHTFIHALYNTSRPLAPVVAAALDLPEGKALRVIDVGGGHGGYSIALAQQHPLLQATVFELPRVVPVAREIIAQAGLADRVQVQEGNFQTDALGSDYDVALVFGVLNGEPPQGRPALLKKVYDALKPGGQIAIRDQVLSNDRTAPVEAALFALQMLLATDSGGLDTREDWTLWLQSAGFGPAHMLPLPEWAGSSITVAEKPTGVS